MTHAGAGHRGPQIVRTQIVWSMDIQPLPLAYKRLLNKPYVNEVNLTGQKSPLKYCQQLEIQYSVRKRVDLLMLKILSL